eukprot:TRINITY_DN270_c0_g1_i3.p1 TRINITY_DN270_c0_g1~~TRINITY_DN270_c0_g1_i3.p1  ORF type:complete len:968 (+),score=309.40 TRINITY_DN270_c0_g1_i3:11-2914(+)
MFQFGTRWQQIKISSQKMVHHKHIWRFITVVLLIVVVVQADKPKKKSSSEKSPEKQTNVPQVFSQADWKALDRLPDSVSKRIQSKMKDIKFAFQGSKLNKKYKIHQEGEGNSGPEAHSSVTNSRHTMKVKITDVRYIDENGNVENIEGDDDAVLDFAESAMDDPLSVSKKTPVSSKSGSARARKTKSMASKGSKASTTTTTPSSSSSVKSKEKIAWDDSDVDESSDHVTRFDDVDATKHHIKDAIKDVFRDTDPEKSLLRRDDLLDSDDSDSDQDLEDDGDNSDSDMDELNLDFDKDGNLIKSSKSKSKSKSKRVKSKRSSVLDSDYDSDMEGDQDVERSSSAYQHFEVQPDDPSKQDEDDSTSEQDAAFQKVYDVMITNATLSSFDDKLTAMSTLEELVKQHQHPAATNLLGDVYRDGELVDRDLGKALEYYKVASEAGNPQAQRSLGFMFSTGQAGLTRDPSTALIHLFFSARAGDMQAQMALGHKHMYGEGVPKSCASAVQYYFSVANEVVFQIQQENLDVVVERHRLSDDESSVAAKRQQNDEDVVGYYRHSAEMGDVQAQVAMGQLNYHGMHGVPRNYEIARRYFELAANRGNPVAQASLGLMHTQGQGVKQDNKTGLKYYRMAAKQNNAEALNGLGYMYLYGTGVEMNYKKAVEYFRKAAHGGSSEGQLNLATLYLTGVGVAKDYKQAVQYFTLSANQGNVEAMFHLGRMHHSGFGVNGASCKRALQLFKTVAERGPAALGLEKAHEKYTEGDIEGALIMYELLSEQGFEIAQSNVAYIYDQLFPDTTELDRHQRALRYYFLASEQGNIDAKWRIGHLCYYGQGTNVSYEDAVHYYTEASAYRHPQAMFNLAYMHQHGLGISQDFHLAKRYYDMVAESSSSGFLPARLAMIGLGLQFLHEKYDEVPQMLATLIPTLPPWLQYGLSVDLDTWAIIALVYLLCLVYAARWIASPLWERTDSEE